MTAFDLREGGQEARRPPAWLRSEVEQRARGPLFYSVAAGVARPANRPRIMPVFPGCQPVRATPEGVTVSSLGYPTVTCASLQIPLGRTAVCRIVLFNDRAQSSELEKHPEVPIYRARVQPSASAASWVTFTHQTSIFKVSWLSLTLTRQAHGCARRVSEAATQQATLQRLVCQPCLLP